jgi:hypothetical protein
VEVSARRGTAVVTGAGLPSRDELAAAVRSAGYEPAAPPWLTTEAATCALLRVPDLDISVDLQDGPNTIQLPALPPGTLPFTCVRGVYTGTLIAINTPRPD